MSRPDNLIISAILSADSYKASHYLQYPPGTQFVSSYIESRGGEYETTVFFGLQAFIKEYLLTPITTGDIDEAQEIITAHGLPFHRAGWTHILDKHGGFLPLHIEAVPEGTIVPTGNVLVQVVNTDPECFWLPSYMETALLRAVWYPSTVATLSHYTKVMIRAHMEKSCDTRAKLPFMLHDFGARGVSSQESAVLGGMAHLVNFQGTDTMAALVGARRYYHEPMAGFSIPAAEHSTICCWGKDREGEAYRNMLTKFGGVRAVVSDSYDIWNAVRVLWGNRLKADVMKGGTVVVRPDSGDPAEVVCKTIHILLDCYEGTMNRAGYWVLPPEIRVIQGDGVSPKEIDHILTEMERYSYSADNIAFGMGGQLLQHVNRDTCKWAMKANAVFYDEQWHDVWKDPVTDLTKWSKRGRLSLVRHGQSKYETVQRDQPHQVPDVLQTVYRNGELTVDQTLSEIRGRAG